MAPEGNFDYSRLTRQGEIKKTTPDRLTPGFVRAQEQQGDLPASKPKDHSSKPSDLPPQGGIIQRRRRGNVTSPIPTNTQERLDSKRTVTRNYTRRGQTPLNGTDQYILDSIEHHGEPYPHARKRALKHGFGRTAGIIRHAEKKQPNNG